MDARRNLGLVIASATTAAAQAPPIELVEFRPESRVRSVGAAARSELAIRNSGSSADTVWIGYSLRDSSGRWFDVAPVQVSLAPRGQARRALEWRVPAIALGGPYRIVMAVWTAMPGSPDATRLLSVDRDEAFRVTGNQELLMEQPSIPWRVASHKLGRGTMQPAQVMSDGNSFRLNLAPARCDGAEMRSTERVGFGTYRARMRVPHAAGSLSAFFLYGDGSGPHDEIDIEIFNDDTRRALLTAWIDGKKSREAEIRLPFDPRAAMHDYAIAWSARELVFRIDGKQVARWTRDFPIRPMRVVANVWWPTWLPCVPIDSTRTLHIERIWLSPAGVP